MKKYTLLIILVLLISISSCSLQKGINSDNQLSQAPETSSENNYGSEKQNGQGKGRNQANGNRGNRGSQNLVADASNQGPLNESEVNALNLAIQDEFKALATYQKTVKQFGEVRPFTNIIDSEQQHIDALKLLFERYEIAVPQPEVTENDITLPDTLSDVCSAAVQAEIDNNDLYQSLLITQLEHSDLKQTFENLARASIENHLPAFERCE